MSVRAGQWLVDAKGNDGLIIVSPGRFSLGLIDVVRNIFDCPLNVKHYVNLHKCFEDLKK